MLARHYSVSFAHYHGAPPLDPALPAQRLTLESCRCGATRIFYRRECDGRAVATGWVDRFGAPSSPGPECGGW